MDCSENITEGGEGFLLGPVQKILLRVGGFILGTVQKTLLRGWRL